VLVKVDVNVVTVVEVTVEGLGFVGSGHHFPGKLVHQLWRSFFRKKSSIRVTWHFFIIATINHGYSWIFTIRIYMHWKIIIRVFFLLITSSYQQSFPPKRSLLPSTAKRAVPRCSLRFTSPSPGEPAPKTRRKFRARHPPGKPRFLQPDFRAGGMTAL